MQEIVLDVFPFVAIGFLAQLVDGSLGMAFGVICSTLMVSVMGMAPARASAAVHLVETATTGMSAISHIVLGNVDWRLLARLAIPGMIGGVTGAYLLTSIDSSVMRPVIMTYLSLIGVYLLYKAWRYQRPPVPKAPKAVMPLGLIGGFLDASGGGGWGPVVTSNLLVQDAEPRRTIGTVNTAEFLLTTSVSITFIATIGFEAFTKATIGLLIGGALAAPLGAVMVRFIPTKALLWLVGSVLTATSLFSLYRALA